MKKSLIALAVAGLFVASTANAQSANVTLYGRVHLDLQFTSSNEHKGLGEQHKMANNSSRIGVKGTEDLGGGLKAFFQVESGFAPDDGNTKGANTLAGRDTYLGLQGTWGSIRFGRLTSAIDSLHGIWGNAPTFNTSILSMEGLWTKNPYSSGVDQVSKKGWTQFAQRHSNAIQYDSIDLNGLKFTAQLYINDESGNDGNKSFAYVGTAQYKKGGLQLGAGVEYADWDKAVKKGASDLEFSMMGGYDFGFIRPAAVVEYIKTKGTKAVAATKNGKDSTDRWLIGASLTAPVGAGKVYTGVAYADDWDNIDDSAAWQAEVSYTYPLSKATSVYAGYVFINNDKGSNYTFSTNPNSDVKKGVDQQGVIFGMIHMF